MLVSDKLSSVELPKGGVFDVLSKASMLEKSIGKDKVIKSIIGSLFDENEEFFVLPSVNSAFRNLPDIDIFNYTGSITGSDDFKNSVKKNLLIDNLPNVEVSASVGGSGAISNVFRAYLGEGQTALLPNYRWESYETMVRANNSKIETYNLFDGDAFNMDDFSAKLLNIVKRDKKVVVVINDPCHNPTGYSLSIDEWKNVVEILKQAGQYGDIILVNDIAYIDYDFRGYKESRQHFQLFADLPQNVLTIIAFSISKSLTSYGLRVGASVAISSNADVITEYNNSINVLCRTTWSNISRGGIELFIKINKEQSLFDAVNKERNDAINLLKQRTEVFTSKAKQIGLRYLPFRSGFFFTIPVDNSIKGSVIDDLEKQNAFVVPVDNGLRIAICSLPIEKSAKLPELLKKSIDKYV
ncbi:MAG: aminotransferase class I/II-fold pyridoxal phosphate-dependent enzyme [Rickettsiales bacterium]|jgi:aspartate/tyrosine/aromatic aminotransferase|nr:aminotransferase class I/II-fold pyridoxal phosphate-dependent enzyme [Rickettsiales bacterium]